MVYNCSGYEKVDTLRKLEGLIDVYLTDLKYVDAAVALKYSGAENYFDYASKAILEMQRQMLDNVFDEAGMLQKGLIIRHLVLPGNVLQTRKVLCWIHENLPKKTLISLMSQYVPCGKAADFKEINRRLTNREYDKACDMMFDFGFENGYIQDLMSAKETYIPLFDLEGV
ncbi:hypothetical protein SDC9_153721 [bioreactor metagenome]|uniref:Radical SAM core domain-containing protein n=1 Tax=bioreactor metagenome TaxID=1076179 RepID=A0A645EWR3_9ZZZZ